MKKTAQSAAPTEQLQQNQARGHRRHNQGQREDRFNHRLAWPVTPRQQQANREAKGQDYQRAERRNPGSEPDELPIFSGHHHYFFGWRIDDGAPAFPIHRRGTGSRNSPISIVKYNEMALEGLLARERFLKPSGSSL